MSEIKRTCFAYDTDKNKCKALKCLYCGIQKEPECTFYKNKDSISSNDIEKDIRHYNPNVKTIHLDDTEEEEA